MLLKKLLCGSYGRIGRGLATRSTPFPVLTDMVDASCPQLVAGKAKNEHQLEQLDQLSKMCMAGGKLAI